MKQLALKAFLGILVLGILPSFAYADHRGGFRGSFRGGFHERGGISLSLGFGGFFGGYGGYYGGYCAPSYYYSPRSYCYDYPRYYSYTTYVPAYVPRVYTYERSYEPASRYDDDYCPPRRSYFDDYPSYRDSRYYGRANYYHGR